jgi:hypothetical protein
VTFAAAGSLTDVASTTWTLTPSAVGNLVCVPVLNDSKTIWATSLSSSNVTWTYAGTYNGVTNTFSVSLFLGKVTSASSATVTIGWNGTTPSYIRGDAHEFSSTVGSWALDGSVAHVDGSGTNTWPSLTPGAGAGELYFGYCLNAGTAAAGSTSGYTYNVDTRGNGQAYNVSCPNSATGPVWGDSGQTDGIMALVRETGAATAGRSLIVPQAVKRSYYW